VSRLNTLEKCVRILTLFSQSARVLTVSQIADRLDLPRSTAYRYISALRAQHLIEETPDGAGYRLGSRILELAATMSRRPLRDTVQPYLEEISRETGETTILCVLRGHVGVCMEKVEGHHALRVSYELGDTYPLHAAATGKAILAYLDPDERDAILNDVGLPRLTETTITRRSDLTRELDRIVRTGYSESRGESIAGTYGIAAPIVSPSGRVIASIGVSMPDSRAEPENRERIVERLIEASRGITEELSA